MHGRAGCLEQKLKNENRHCYFQVTMKLKPNQIFSDYDADNLAPRIRRFKPEKEVHQKRVKPKRQRRTRNLDHEWPQAY
jgi:hypothetical protein